MTNKPVSFDQHGIIIQAFKGRVLGVNATKVNPKFAPLMEKLCQWMKDNGYKKLATLGIRNNRKMRKVNKTSRHSDGTAPDFKAWPDGTTGSYGIDIEGFYGHKISAMDYTTRDKKDKKYMVGILEVLGFRVYHKGKITPEHLHAEYPNPTTWK